MDFRKTFDRIPDQFDKWRPRYCDELFRDIIEYANIGPGKSVLEIGPGTGQATEPFLKTGCDYLAIELGEHFVDFTKKKFGTYENFHIVNDDFETHDFGERKFDLVFSAATIQWIPEEIGFPKVFNLLKNGGALAMFMTYTDEKTSNGSLYDEIQKVYDEHFHVETKYTCSLNYDNVVNYGFVDLNYRDWKRPEYIMQMNMWNICPARRWSILHYRSRISRISTMESEKQLSMQETESFWMTQLHYI